MSCDGLQTMRIDHEGQCALCQQVAVLRNSHIIPEFLYGTLYDEKNRFNTFGKRGEPKVGIEQKGFREHLLCDACEQRFSGYERVVASFYYGTVEAFAAQKAEVNYRGGLKFTRVNKDARPTTDAVPKLLYVEGVNYSALKLFLLSLLWRMGVSRLHFFREVELGPHESQLRSMLLKDDPGEPDVYACQMSLIEADKRLLTDYQSQPRKFSQAGQTYYRLYTTGIRLDFCVSNHPIHPGMVELYCVKRQDYFTWCVDSIHQHPDLVAELIKFGFAMNWNKS
jgi:hypothetical protein